MTKGMEAVMTRALWKLGPVEAIMTRDIKALITRDMGALMIRAWMHF